MSDEMIRINTDHAVACFHALWHSHFLVLQELAKAKMELGQLGTGWKQDLLDHSLNDLEALTVSFREGDPAKVQELEKHISDDARRAASEVVGRAFDRIVIG